MSIVYRPSTQDLRLQAAQKRRLLERYIVLVEKWRIDYYLAHPVLQLQQTTSLHNLALASSSDANNTLGMKLVDSF